MHFNYPDSPGKLHQENNNKQELYHVADSLRTDCSNIGLSEILNNNKTNYHEIVNNFNNMMVNGSWTTVKADTLGEWSSICLIIQGTQKYIY